MPARVRKATQSGNHGRALESDFPRATLQKVTPGQAISSFGASHRWKWSQHSCLLFVTSLAWHPVPFKADSRPLALTSPSCHPVTRLMLWMLPLVPTLLLLSPIWDIIFPTLSLLGQNSLPLRFSRMGLLQEAVSDFSS